MLDLIVMRLADMKRVHPEQITDKCAGCGHAVGIYPSGAKNHEAASRRPLDVSGLSNAGTKCRIGTRCRAGAI